MAKQIKLIQQRPNTAMFLKHNADDSFKNLKLLCIATITTKVLYLNELIRTWTLVFTTEENYNEFLNEVKSLDYNAPRQTYNSNNANIPKL